MTTDAGLCDCGVSLMKVYPLIHSRTGGCDYSSKLIVRPPNFSDADIKWARKGTRLNLTPTFKAPSTASFAAACSAKATRPKLLLPSFGNGLKNISRKKWNRKVFDGVPSELEDCDKLSDAYKSYDPKYEKFFAAQIYDAAAFDDEELFKMYLFETAKRDVAFCSNVEDIQRVEEGVYNAVTTSAGNIATLKAHWEKELDRRNKEKQRRLEEERRRKEEQQRREREEQERLKLEEEQRRAREESAEKNFNYDEHIDSNNTDEREISVAVFVSRLNTFSRDCILEDTTTGKRFRAAFIFKDGYNFGLAHGNPKIECKLEEIR